MSLNSQRILIVGGSSGIGLETARLAAQRGAEVLIAGRNPERLRAAGQSVGMGVQGMEADFTDEASVARLMDRAARIDHLVLAASINPALGQFREVGLDALRRAFEGKLFGYWACAQRALPVLRLDGSVTMLAGAASRVGVPGTAGVAAVNGAITQMAQTLAKELAPLRVNVVSPGMIDTPAFDGMPAGQRQAMFDHAAAAVSSKRIGRAAEIADAVMFLIGNGFTTGALLDVDGGARA